ncbi:hypothetical protein CLAFUW4_02959 [Fulvia fulva]|uniref:N-acetyltransferase domain-containing protein n=1 Tax=Passalora fulva TaxID=5499 RepID=A0A9Q8LA68_PASFU|nr:uncharacterized protein CLAFUR5_02945 [Fulvia fulva]KAK4631157.1 hypothetical protein CLAFUR4_02952 [Fulvia fulva]KAK4633194.1 hypothetical protein CLAFUR0_02955 [Fulvia fulva]UJO13760.1 hypothetical protein CLAFUR5_02945 [Fulvia fulva]WPV11537.1 hypothetical protein CLAFUW4_02959 [Fulvia fulva]WPV26845.1 hypothetical protein CLAFUW7_02956 [Fulvia fulva]
MATMMPQPGHGSFLLDQGLGKKKARRAYRGRGGRSKKNKMDPQQEEADQADNFATLLANGTMSTPPAENQSIAPRTTTTIDAENLLSQAERVALGSPPSLALHAQTTNPPTTYTTTKKTPSMATTTTTTKAVPPHLRPKKSTPPASQPVTRHNDGALEIREKLASHGVTVSDPKPAPKIAKSVAASAHQSEVSDRLVYKGRGCRPWGGERNPNWPTKEDFPKVDPKRWDTNWDDNAQAQSSSGDSARADSGWGTNKKRRGVDADGYKLADPWSGQWAPAPVDWDSRPAFRSDQNEGQIQQWLNCHEMILAKNVTEEERVLSTGPTTIGGTTYAFNPSDEAVSSGAEQPMGDMCPSYWIPVVFRRISPQQHWEEILLSTPAPEDKDDLRDVRPYWETLPRGAHFFPVVEFPAITGVDPDENAMEKLKREHDMGSGQHAENRKNFERAKAAAKNEKQRLKAQKKAHITAKVIKSAGSLKQEPAIKPGFKIFLRSAKPIDMQAIRDIYNHYVNATCAVPETVSQTDGDMLRQYHDVLRNKMPFIVAVERGGVVKARKKKNFGEDLVLPDKVIGFAFANDYKKSSESMYCYAASLSIFVHVDHHGKGVGSCLMDKMLALLDPGHIERGGYNIEGEELEALGPPARVLKSILIEFSHEQTTQGTKRLAWTDRWLATLGFWQQGLLSEIGSKLTHAVDLAIFHRRTGTSA